MILRGSLNPYKINGGREFCLRLFSDVSVQIINQIGGIDDLTDFNREVEERG
jgi:hypothetical protein